MQGRRCWTACPHEQQQLPHACRTLVPYAQRALVSSWRSRDRTPRLQNHKESLEDRMRPGGALPGPQLTQNLTGLLLFLRSTHCSRWVDSATVQLL